MSEYGPEYDAYAEHFKRVVREQIDGSAVGIAIGPDGKPDPKFCMEIGYMLMTDKPIILLVRPGVHVPEKLARITDAIVEIHPDDKKATIKRIKDAIKGLLPRRKK